MQDKKADILGLSERIIKIRKSQGLTQDVFAQKYGVSRNSQLEYEKGRTVPSGDYLGRLAADGYDVNALLTGESVIKAKEYFGIREDVRVSKEDVDGFVSVPRYDIQVSAGNGTQAQSEQIVDYFKFKKSWLTKRGLDPMHLTMVEVIGDSMEPLLTEGDVVLVDHKDTQLKTGRAYVLRIYHELLVKFVEVMHDGRVKVISQNEYYPPWEVDYKLFDGAEDHIKIIGRVVASSHNW